MVEEVAAREETKMQAFHVLAQWTLQRFKLWPGWTGASINDEERATTLELLVRLARLNKRCRENVVHTPEFAASRLAVADVAATTTHPDELKIIIIRRFEENLALLGRSWLLQTDMPDRLRLSKLGELNIADLMEVRKCLKSGWMQEFHIPPGGVNATNSQVWVTPASRSWEKV